jgi:hypothetical protein
MAKDLFSNQASLYAQYRPGYPNELYEYILQQVNNRQLAWDCATGMDRRLLNWPVILSR